MAEAGAATGGGDASGAAPGIDAGMGHTSGSRPQGLAPGGKPAPEKAAPKAAPVAKGTAPAGKNALREMPAKESADVSADAASSQKTHDTSPKTVRVKINGREAEVTIDELTRGYQLGAAAHEKFKEAATQGQRAKEMLDRMKADPMAAAIELGVDPKVLRDNLEKFYKRQYLDREMMTPEQLELQELREYREKQETDAKSTKEREEAKTAEGHKETFRKSYQERLISALSEADLPIDEVSVGRAASRLKDALAAKIDMSTPEFMPMVMEKVKQSYQNEHKRMYAKSTGDQLIAILGEDNIRKIRLADLNRLRGGDPNAVPGDAPAAPKPRHTNGVDRRSSDRISVHDFRKQLGAKVTLDAD